MNRCCVLPCPVSACLCCVVACCAGLTLVRANHVFLLEPALDPAIEQQAIARVHRIGQERPVLVSRLVVENSVEEDVLRLQRGRQALFEDDPGGGGGSGEEEDEVATVAAVVGAEVVGAEDAEKLLDAVLGGKG